MNILESLIYIVSGKESACLPTQEMQETQVGSLVQEDPLEKEMATHSSILAWKKSHGQRSLTGYSPWGAKSWTQLSTCQ